MAALQNRSDCHSSGLGRRRKLLYGSSKCNLFHKREYFTGQRGLCQYSRSGGSGGFRGSQQALDCCLELPGGCLSIPEFCRLTSGRFVRVESIAPNLVFVGASMLRPYNCGMTIRTEKGLVFARRTKSDESIFLLIQDCFPSTTLITSLLRSLNKTREANRPPACKNWQTAP